MGFRIRIFIYNKLTKYFISIFLIWKKKGKRKRDLIKNDDLFEGQKTMEASHPSASSIEFDSESTLTRKQPFIFGLFL